MQELHEPSLAFAGRLLISLLLCYKIDLTFYLSSQSEIISLIIFIDLH